MLVFALCAHNSECFFLVVTKCLKHKQLSKVLSLEQKLQILLKPYACLFVWAIYFKLNNLKLPDVVKR